MNGLTIREVCKGALFAMIVTMVALLIVGGATAAPGDNSFSFSSKFYANRAGVEFESPEKEATFLKKLGYEGLSQDWEFGDKLAPRMAAHQKADSGIVSLYWKVNSTEKPLTAKQFEPLRGSNAIIEVSVWKLRENTLAAILETADTAASMDIRLAIYPHKGHEIDTMASAINLMKEIDRPNVGVVFVLCHFLRLENVDTLEAVLESAMPHLYAVSTSGGDIGSEDWGKLIQPLDKGTFPQGRLFAALKRLRYDGPVFLQAWWGVKDPEQKRANLESSIGEWRTILEELESGEQDAGGKRE